MVDHKITGVIGASPSVEGMEGGAHLTERGAELLPLLPAAITMDPAGIDLFHAILQIVFAHLYSPYRLKPDSEPTAAEIQENRTAALAFLQSGRAHDANGTPRVTISVNDEQGVVTQYVLAHRARTIPIVLRIDPRESLRGCIKVQVPSGIFVGFDFSTLKVPSPPGRPA